MENFNFILNGCEYAAFFEGDEVSFIYSVSEGRHLLQDHESNERERPQVWVAAYTMREG